MRYALLLIAGGSRPLLVDPLLPTNRLRLQHLLRRMTTALHQPNQAITQASQCFVHHADCIPTHLAFALLPCLNQ